MRKIAAISMLALLLYNTFGLSIAVLFFQKDFYKASELSSEDEWQILKFEAPSLPYTSHWQNEEGIPGLIEKDGAFFNTTNVSIENDTLYVTLKSNLNARDRFSELAAQMERVTHKDQNSSAPNNPVKLLADLTKIYLQINGDDWIAGCRVYLPSQQNAVYKHASSLYRSLKTGHHSPPPEIA